MGIAARKRVEDMFSLDVLRKKIDMVLDAIFDRQDEVSRFEHLADFTRYGKC
jgi:hypothetical protein